MSDPRTIHPDTSSWPTQLADLGAETPERLHVAGDGELRLLALRSVAIVGSRAATPYGMTVAARLAEDLCAAGWVVVSGAAYGIDSAGHRGALQSGGCTIAVVAGGLGHHLDAPGADLLRRIRAQGLVVSEADHAASPRKHSFLHRNRLIAALTRATVVVEAAQRSGALNTARRADSLGRVVAAVPGPVTGGASTGTHALIRDGRAVLVRGISDVLELIEPLGTVPPPASRP